MFNQKIYFLLISLFTFPVYADWVLVSVNDVSDEFYIDSETIIKDGNKVNCWEKIHFSDQSQEFKSVRIFEEIDCKKRTHITLQVTAFSEYNGM